MNMFYLVTGMALVTFGVRYILLPLSGRISLSERMQRALRFVPPVILTAIIVPAVLYPNGQPLQLCLTNSYLLGAVATAVIGKVSKNLLITIGGGMACFALYQWLLK